MRCNFQWDTTVLRFELTGKTCRIGTIGLIHAGVVAAIGSI
jgi:hypothetical protein